VASRGRGGVEKRFINYANFLAYKNDSSYEYTFLVNRSILLEEEYEVLNRSKNIKLITYKSDCFKKVPRINKKLHLLAFYPKVFSLQRKFNFDIIHYATFTALHTFKLFKNSKKIVSLYTGFYQTLNYKLKNKLFQKTIEVAHFDCLSSLIADQLIKSTSIRTNRIHTAPGSFIDLKKTQTEIKNKENIIVFLGGLIDQKGVHLLISLIENWHKINTDYKLLILGKGQAENRIIEKISKDQLNNQITLSYTNDPKSYLRKSKIFLSLQKGENYPSQSLLEAMACKNTIVATDVGLTYKLVDETNGVRIQSNIESLISGINKLIKNIENDNSLFENSRKKVLKEHSIEKFDEYINDIYSQI
jgi:GalNAc-alpha-(1->4)-GalNAc-alpha-(1->3)-diNAcBac-PP-undecaprenol alpha-1,4-N-acetyl-D-galactosaminyltransferase